MNNEINLNLFFSESEFVILESGSRMLNEYITNLNVNAKEKYKRIVMVKELAKKKLNTTILDDTAICTLIKEINNLLAKKKESTSSLGSMLSTSDAPNNKSFKNLILEDSLTVDHSLIKNNFIFNSSIIYVDSIRDIKNITNTVYKNLKINEDVSSNLFSYAIDKPKIFLNNFNLIKHFLLTNSDYKTKFQKNAEGMEISTLDCLLGKSEEVIVLGMLMFNEEGTIQLQDNNKIVNVDISDCDWGKGYFTQGCVILCQGFYKDDVLKAKAIVHPPHAWNNFQFKEKFDNDFFGAITKAFKSQDQNEDKISSFPQSENNNINSFLGSNISTYAHTNNVNNSTSNKPEENFLLHFLNKDLSLNKYLLPKSLEGHINLNLDTLIKSNYNLSMTEKIFKSTKEFLSDEFFILISNPDLNNPNVLIAIEKIITGYNSPNSHIPFMIIFVGNFVSENSFSTYKTYSNIFDNLANIILKNTQILKNTYIVFIPGPEDFSLFSGFPKHPIIHSVINPLKKKIPNIISATNPCRFSIFGKEIVIFRDNLNKKLARNSIIKCTDINKNKDFLIHTILSQGNLSPFDLNISSKIWHLSQCLNILPLPDFLIIADVVEDFYLTNNISTIVNPGNFTKDFSFNLIFPLKNSVEPCKINI